jgi:WD40 repeat protein
MLPRPPRTGPGRAFALVALALLAATPAAARERRERLTPGLVLETGALHATCDVLLFSPDANELLAAGDDKVVRIWQAEKDTLRRESRVLRWPTFREQRGGIYAMALSPDDGGARVAVAGFGAKNGVVAVLGRRDGAVLDVLAKPESPEVNWALAWSPDGKFVVYGNERGELFRWRPGARSRDVRKFAGRGQPANRVRLIAFSDARHFLSVARDGKVWRRDVNDLETVPAAPVASFDLPKKRQLIAAVAFSRASKLLAACAEYDPNQIHLLDLSPALGDKRPLKGKARAVPLAVDKARDRYGWSLAFNARGDKLAVGTRDVNQGANVPAFARVTGGGVFVYSLKEPVPKLLTSPAGLDCGYAVDALAFRPGADDRLAAAGGPHHEVRLWRVGRESSPLAEVRGPGSCLYAVQIDAKSRYVAWQEAFDPKPKHPNARGAGPWRYFKLDRATRSILSQAPGDFTPRKALDSYAGWRVKTDADSYSWQVIDPKGNAYPLSEESGLYLQAIAQVPRCYNFVPPAGKKPLRLAVGHMWGVSLYELRPGKVDLVRFLVGHEGEVMSVVASADGKLLYTASRDQTLACWSLEDWPTETELGARFLLQDGKVVVEKVDAGSPAWEMGLTDSDEVVLVLSADRQGGDAFLYDPEKRGLKRHGLTPPGEARPLKEKEILKRLNDAKPIREYVLVWRHEGKETQQVTTVKQRPLWRFFPTRQDEGSQWVLWRWRDFLYDTASPRADRLVGWQVQPRDMASAPTFHPLANYQSRFHNPPKVWKFIASTNHEPEKVLFPDIEAPRVTVRAEPRPRKDDPMTVRITITPHDPESPDQKIDRVIVWLNDTLMKHRLVPDPKTGELDFKATVSRERLHIGENRLKVVCFNKKGGRAEASDTVEFDDPARPRPTLRALSVGLNYKGRKGGDLGPLLYPAADAEAMAKVFKQQAGSKLFGASKVDLVPEHEATREALLERLKALGEGAKPDDWLVLFLAGHGMQGRDHETNVFRFLCAESDPSKDETLLDANDLHRALRAIPCNKLIFLNACYSGNVTSSPIRALNRDGVEFRVFSACEPGLRAIDSAGDGGAPGARRGGGHTLFTQCLLYALGDPKRGLKRSQAITDARLAGAVERRMRQLLEKMRRPPDAQRPEFYPDRASMKDTPILSVP